MARHFTIRSFFRQMPNALLQRYFQGRGLLPELKFAAMSETKPKELYDAWDELADAERGPIEAEFHEVFNLSNDLGWLAIRDEAAFHFHAESEEFAEFMGAMSALDGHYERAMTAFLEYPQFWKGASLFCYADNLPRWCKRKNIPKKTAATDEASLQELAHEIGAYFRETEGRGNNCVVEPFRRGALGYFFAYPEDFSQRIVEWSDNKFKHRQHNPAFEVVYVYSESEGTLDVNVRGAKKIKTAMHGVFAKAILKLLKLPDDPKDLNVYCLDGLLDRDFQFIYETENDIAKVALKSVSLQSSAHIGERVTLEADVSKNAFALYDLMDRVKASLPLNAFTVYHAEIEAHVVLAPGKTKRVQILLSHPNYCNLKHDEIGEQLRNMLAASGIEPRSVQQGETP